MPKPMFVWSGTQWVSVASEVESLAGFATQSYADNTPGTRLIVPTSVAVGSGTGSVGTSGAVTFSGASSISLNGCFSSTYQNYLITYNTAGTASSTLRLRFRASGTDTSATSWFWGVTRINYSTSSVNGYTGNGINYYEVSDLVNSTTDVFDGTINILRPNDAVFTNISNTGHGAANGAHNGSGVYAVNTVFDGFTLFTSSGTASGTIRVYGMKN